MSGRELQLSALTLENARRAEGLSQIRAVALRAVAGKEDMSRAASHFPLPLLRSLGGRRRSSRELTITERTKVELWR